MRKKTAAIVMTAVFTVALSIPAFAGQWQQDAKGWWYQEDNGTHFNNGWNYPALKRIICRGT